MEFTNPNSENKTLVDKNEVIKVLQQLIDEYPLEMVPRRVIEEALTKVLDPQTQEAINTNSAFQKLEETLARAKSVVSLP